jgi:hypothetical protein
VKVFDLVLLNSKKKKHEGTRYHENTKGRSHERGGGYIEIQVLFRAFVVNGFDLAFGVVSWKTPKQPLITKTRKGKNTKEEGLHKIESPFSCFPNFLIS